MKKSAVRTAQKACAKRVIFHPQDAFAEIARLHLPPILVSIAHLSVNILTRSGTDLTLFSGCAKMKRPMRRAHTKACISIAILLACCRCASALDPSLDVSQYAHTAWKIRDGFSKGIIYAIAQTPDGYLWLGTEFGLLRFDGVRAVP